MSDVFIILPTQPTYFHKHCLHFLINTAHAKKKSFHLFLCFFLKQQSFLLWPVPLTPQLPGFAILLSCLHLQDCKPFVPFSTPYLWKRLVLCTCGLPFTSSFPHSFNHLSSFKFLLDQRGIRGTKIVLLNHLLPTSFPVAAFCPKHHIILNTVLPSLARWPWESYITSLSLNPITVNQDTRRPELTLLRLKGIMMLGYHSAVPGTAWVPMNVSS